MENRFFTLVLVVTLGVVVGVMIVTKQSQDPIFRTLLEQQSKMLRSQSIIEGKLNSSGMMAGNDVKQLEQRIATLEAQVKALQAQRVVQPQAQAPEPQEDVTKVYNIEPSHTPIYGKKDAPVMIVEFVDFQCPFCSRFHSPMVEAVKAYPGKVSYMLKNFPLSFHPQSKPAAKAAFAAGEQGKYYEMVDAILADNRSLSEDKFKELAQKIG